MRTVTPLRDRGWLVTKGPTGVYTRRLCVLSRSYCAQVAATIRSGQHAAYELVLGYRQVNVPVLPGVRVSRAIINGDVVGVLVHIAHLYL